MYRRPTTSTCSPTLTRRENTNSRANVSRVHGTASSPTPGAMGARSVTPATATSTAMASSAPPACGPTSGSPVWTPPCSRSSSSPRRRRHPLPAPVRLRRNVLLEGGESPSIRRRRDCHLRLSAWRSIASVSGSGMCSRTVTLGRTDWPMSGWRSILSLELAGLLGVVRTLRVRRGGPAAAGCSSGPGRPSARPSGRR